jgi:predicted alpha-1,2-mannosidase
MNRTSIFLFTTLFLTLFYLGCNTAKSSKTNRSDPADSLTSYVNPFIGTSGSGNVFPEPVAPFGMIQPGPDTDDKDYGTASGYDYRDSSIIGFSMTHFSGTGIPDLGDFLFMPSVKKPKLKEGSKKNPDSGYRQRYSHKDESASPGYYQVKLQDSGVNVEITAGKRAAIMRYTFPKADSAYILTDLQHMLHWKVIWAHLRVENDSTITGSHITDGWAKNRHIYFAAQYSRPFDHFRIYKNEKPVIYNTYRFNNPRMSQGKDLKFIARFAHPSSRPIYVKVAVSAVSAQNALENLKHAIPHWNFQHIRKQTSHQWEKQLSKITIQGSKQKKENFYTAMYHAFINPSLYEDANGQYRGEDQNIHQTKDFTNYTIFSLWDTYRALHPLYTLIQRKKDADFINSMLALYDQSTEHMLPIWSLQANETWCMIGYHAVPVIADAYMKGVKGFDPERAYEAMKTTAMNPDYDNVMTYAKLGWVPADKENESVSKTLEYAFDDYTIAQMAKKMGKTKDYKYFMDRADNYKNIYDPEVGLMRGRNTDGSWHKPFHPHKYVFKGPITEGTNWQYSWYVPQDVPGLIKLMGGKKAFAAKLDSLFAGNGNTTSVGKDTLDITGRIGWYVQGNETDQQVPFFYDYAGKPWKTQYWSRYIDKHSYHNRPDGLIGNDDCGQMSAWYIFSSLGFYPVAPASNTYAIGSPSVKKATIHLSNGNTFTVRAKNLSHKNVYIQSATLNGKDWDKPYITDNTLESGGSLVFTMGPKPNKSWGVDADIPH